LKVAVFWGCCIAAGQYGYEMSVREVFPKLDVELVDLREEVCCGDPVKSVNDFAANYLGARVLALAHLTGTSDLLVPCNRCHFTISEAKRLVDSDEQAGQKIRSLLKEEGLEYDSGIRFWHVIDFLHDFVGPKTVKQSVSKPLKGLRVASHVGCQLIRYSNLGRADDAENPRKLDELIESLGAESVDYSEKLDCCGSHLSLSHPDSALSLGGTKLKAVKALGVSGLVVSCPECGLMFDSKQKDAESAVAAKLGVPVVYFTQLLGLAMNLDRQRLGLHLNLSPVDELLSKIPG
jgi:heterodisulfide reductase subunit B